MPHRDLQEAVFALMGDPSTHDGSKVRRIDTHAAVVWTKIDASGASEHTLRHARAALTL